MVLNNHIQIMLSKPVEKLAENRKAEGPFCTLTYTLRKPIRLVSVYVGEKFNLQYFIFLKKKILLLYY